MFVHDDFDLDEDILKDISQTESKYYSQALSSDEESSFKRIRTNKNSSVLSESKTILNFEKIIHVKSKKDSMIQNTNDVGGKKTIRTNLILARLNRNENTTLDPTIHQYADRIDSQSSNLAESNLAQQPFLHPTNDECRKNLILEKLKRSNIGRSCPTNLNSVNLNNSKSDHRETVEKSQLKPVDTCNKPVTLVRRFPGPAGLLPHSSDEILPPLVPETLCFDNSNNSTDSDVVDDSPIISKYCSQNTANSLSDGAWHLLKGDLSPHFLDRHQISAAKQKMLTNLCRNYKLPFLAGAVQRVDFSRLDPLIVLKDCTGTIKGTVCKDILVNNSHFLDIGVVLFLGNVGYLTIGLYPKKCHVIFKLKNIINVYTCKSRIFSISEMDARLQNLNVECGLTMERIRATGNTNTDLYPSNSKNGSNFDKCTDYTCNPMVVEKFSKNKRINLEASETCAQKGSNLLKNINKNSNSFQRDANSLHCTNHINIKPTFESEDIQGCDDDLTASFLDIDDNLLSKAPRKLHPTANSRIKPYTSILMNENTVVFKKNSVLDATHSNPQLPQDTEYLVTKTCNIGNGSTEIPGTTGIKKARSATMQKSNLTRAADIKLKLSVFKSNTELTPQPSKDFDVALTNEFHKQNESSSTSGLLLNEENGSDEELFSQLDLESIVANYNRLNDVN